MIAFADCTRDDLGLNSAGFGFYPIILRMEGLKALVQKYFSSYSDLSIVQWRHYEQRTNDRLVKNRINNARKKYRARNCDIH